MRVDFYLLGGSRLEAIACALAAKALGEGGRLLIVAGEEAQRNSLSQALWEGKAEAFLANGLAQEPHAERQPILLSDVVEPVNGAQLLCLADGVWREAAGFERVFLLVGEEALPEARRRWKALGEEGSVERRFWKQDARGRWTEGP